MRSRRSGCEHSGGIFFAVFLRLARPYGIGEAIGGTPRGFFPARAPVRSVSPTVYDNSASFLLLWRVLARSGAAAMSNEFDVDDLDEVTGRARQRFITLAPCEF